jgi:hypothetical protein
MNNRPNRDMPSVAEPFFRSFARDFTIDLCSIGSFFNPAPGIYSVASLTKLNDAAMVMIQHFIAS